MIESGKDATTMGKEIISYVLCPAERSRANPLTKPYLKTLNKRNVRRIENRNRTEVSAWTRISIKYGAMASRSITARKERAWFQNMRQVSECPKHWCFKADRVLES